MGQVLAVPPINLSWFCPQEGEVPAVSKIKYKHRPNGTAGTLPSRRVISTGPGSTDLEFRDLSPKAKPLKSIPPFVGRHRRTVKTIGRDVEREPG